MKRISILLLVAVIVAIVGVLQLTDDVEAAESLDCSKVCRFSNSKDDPLICFVRCSRVVQRKLTCWMYENSYDPCIIAR